MRGAPWIDQFCRLVYCISCSVARRMPRYAKKIHLESGVPRTALDHRVYIALIAFPLTPAISLVAMVDFVVSSMTGNPLSQHDCAFSENPS